MLDTSPYSTVSEVETAALKLLVMERRKCPTPYQYIIHTDGSGAVTTGWISYLPSEAKLEVRSETRMNRNNTPQWRWAEVRDDAIRSVAAQSGSLQDLIKHGCQKSKIDIEKEAKDSLRAIQEFDKE